MEDAGIKAGSLVLVRKQDTLEDGEIGVIIVNSEEATIKRFYRQGDRAILQPENKSGDRVFLDSCIKPETVDSQEFARFRGYRKLPQKAMFLQTISLKLAHKRFLI